MVAGVAAVEAKASEVATWPACATAPLHCAPPSNCPHPPLLQFVLGRLRKQRATEIDCDAAGALASAAAMFRRRGATTTLDGQPLQGEQRRLLGGSGGILEQQQQGAAGRQLEELEQQQQQRRQEFVQLGDVCFLFARKFSPETVPVSASTCADGVLSTCCC